MVQQSSKKGLEADFINDILYVWRQYLPPTLQHLETTSTLEVLQNKV